MTEKRNPQIILDDIDSQKERLINKKESKEFFYSESLNCYIAKQPLKIDNRAVKAASECGINLSWDDEGRVKDITYFETKKLAEKLGSTILSPTEFWKLYNEALQSDNKELLSELMSENETEWLDVVFEKDENNNIFMIEHPKINENENGIKIEGHKVKIDLPEGRPGWFNPKDNINPDTGMPLHVDTKREKGTPAWTSANWKYWSVFKINEPVAGIRGYVTSSGTPSFDLDIPLGAKQPVLMMRECRKTLIDPPINPELLHQGQKIVQDYEKTIVEKPAVQNSNEHEIFYNNRKEIFNFITENGKEFVNNQDKEVQKIKEKIIDILGEISVLATSKNDVAIYNETKQIARNLFGIEKETLSINDFTNFIKGTRNSLKEAINSKAKIVFVMGHKNPDTDSAVSCIAEAFRNNILDNNTSYIPVIQGSRIPDEIQYLLGEEITKSIVLSSEFEYEQALKSGLARWILVDQNVSEIQRFAISIVDHHILSANSRKQDISTTWEMAGSTTALVAQKIKGMGLEIDPGLAKILYGATLMDTENRSDKKMTYKDKLIMDELKKVSGVKVDNDFFQDLMSNLLNTDDAESLFNRDYKQDWGIFGFAVAKVKGVFDKDGNVSKKDLLDRLENLAYENNKKKNFPITIVKLVDYLDDNETVNRERIYLIYNDHVLPEFKQTMSEFIKRIIENEFKNDVQIDISDKSVDFWGVGDQLSRKVTAPFLEPIVEAFNEFYFSPSTGLNVKREFLKNSDELNNIAKELNIDLSHDKEGRINNITFAEAKQLLAKQGLSMMSASDYWKILKETEEIHDEQMLKHLKSKGFVELLDTIILDKKYIINHPDVIKNEDGFEYSGDKKEINIPEGVPGLIYPEDIDLDTGFPKISHDPRTYGDKRLWRYWSPDSNECVPTRGYIFLLDQPALDNKIHPEDALPNLGIRPCCKNVKPPKVEIITDENGVRAKIVR